MNANKQEQEPKWPPRANFQAMDDNGVWYFYQFKPQPDCGFWNCKAGWFAVNHDRHDSDKPWKDTLEEKIQTD